MQTAPLWSYCIVEREELKSSSIYIDPKIAQRNASTDGILIYAGAGCEPFVKALMGRKVYFKNFAGDWKKINGKDAYFIEETDIIAADLSDDDLTNITHLQSQVGKSTVTA